MSYAIIRNTKYKRDNLKGIIMNEETRIIQMITLIKKNHI